MYRGAQKKHTIIMHNVVPAITRNEDATKMLHVQMQQGHVVWRIVHICRTSRILKLLFLKKKKTTGLIYPRLKV